MLKRTSIGRWLLFSFAFLGALLLTACSNPATASARKPRVVEVAVTTVGGTTLLPEQLGALLAALRPQLAPQGMAIAQRGEHATDIVFVQFTPDSHAPSGGHIAIVGLQPKPRKAAENDPLTDADSVIRRSGP